MRNLQWVEEVLSDDPNVSEDDFDVSGNENENSDGTVRVSNENKSNRG